VFGDVEVHSQEEIHDVWKRVKAKEKEDKVKRVKRSLKNG